MYTQTTSHLGNSPKNTKGDGKPQARTAPGLISTVGLQSESHRGSNSREQTEEDLPMAASLLQMWRDDQSCVCECELVSVYRVYVQPGAPLLTIYVHVRQSVSADR
jgi:hypothetical protein